MILFGSRAGDQASPISDFDVAVFTGQPLSLEEKIKYTEEAGNLLGTPAEKVDLVDAFSASPLLQYEIAKNGRVIFGDKETFFDFVLWAWKRYHDTAKLRSLRKIMLEEIYA